MQQILKETYSNKKIICKASKLELTKFLKLIINFSFFCCCFIKKGVLKETQNYFKIDDSSSGLLQTVFICSYMLLAPLFGYLG